MDNTEANTQGQKSSVSSASVKSSSVEKKQRNAKQKSASNTQNKESVAVEKTKSLEKALTQSQPKQQESQRPQVDNEVREDSSVREARIAKQLQERIKKEFGLEDPKPEVEEEVVQPEAEATEDTQEVSQDQVSEEAEESEASSEEQVSRVDKEILGSEENTETKEEVDSSSLGAEDGDLEKFAEEQGIDKSQLKEYSIKKLVKGNKKLTYKLRSTEAELKALKEKAAVSGGISQDSIEWTEDFASRRQGELTNVVNKLYEVLDSEVQKDEEGREIPIEIGGAKWMRADLRKEVRRAQEELTAIPSKVSAYKEFESKKSEYESLAAQDISWYADEESPINQRAQGLWSQFKSGGERAVPFAEYIFALGFDALNKKHGTPSKKDVVVKQPAAPKQTTATAAPKAKMATQTGPQQAIAKLEAKYRASGDQRDLKELIKAKQAQATFR